MQNKETTYFKVNSPIQQGCCEDETMYYMQPGLGTR